MARLEPLIIAENNRCINCKVCEIVCHTWQHEQGRTVGTVAGPVLPNLHVQPAAAQLTAVQCRPCGGTPCDFCSGRDQGPICIEACPEGALRLVDPFQDKCDKNRKAAQAIAGVRRHMR